MSRFLMGIDIGTSACKIALFELDGTCVAQESSPYSVTYPRNGWSQQNPDEWWSAVCASVKKLVTENHISPDDVIGIGLDGQSWSAVAIDSDGNVLCDTPIWTDTRSVEECKEIASLIGDDTCFEVSGNPLSPCYTTPKILWYKNHQPEVYKKARYILQSNSFIVYRLTGEITQDTSQGYGLACFDMKNAAWRYDLMEKMGLRPELLPPIMGSHEIAGVLTKEAAELLGLKAGIPVAAGGLDAACGALGAGVASEGQTQEQGGQAEGMSICTHTYVADKRLIMGRHVVPGAFLLQGGTTGGGGALKWFKEQMCPELSFVQMSELAGQVAPGCDGVVFLPYMSGERSPLWNPNACGVFFGLNYAKTRAHLIRAVMEGVAFSLRHNLEVAAAAGGEAGILHAMGGSASSAVFTQIKADITGHEMIVPENDTATMLGASLLAGVGIGAYPSCEEAVAKTVKFRKEYHPNPANKSIYDLRYSEYLALYEKLCPMMKSEAERQ